MSNLKETIDLNIGEQDRKELEQLKKEIVQDILQFGKRTEVTNAKMELLFQRLAK